MGLDENNIKEYLANTPQITFEITERCNLSCLYCGYGKLYSNRGDRQGRSLSVTNAITFLDYLKDLWENGVDTQGNAQLIVSFYGGEPLLNIDFITQVVDYIEKHLAGYNRMFTYSMTTNALLLSKYINYLVDKNFRLLISLDGDEVGSSLRVTPNGKPAFNKIIKEVDYVASSYPNFFRNNVEFNSVLNSRTSIKDIITYIRGRYGKFPTISEINTDGVNPEERENFLLLYKKKWLDDSLYYEQDTESFINHPQFERVARYILMHSPYTYLDYNELLFDNRTQRKELPTGTCFPFVKKAFITVTGNIMPCERINYRYTLGKIDEYGVHIDFAKIAEKYNMYYEKVRPTCDKCSNNNGCLCCMFSNGQLDTPQCKCSYFMTPQDAIAMKNEVWDFLKRFPKAYSYIMNSYEVII